MLLLEYFADTQCIAGIFEAFYDIEFIKDLLHGVFAVKVIYLHLMLDI
jgi:hypothetical protein